MNITWKGAHENNFKVGRDGKSVSKIILHWIVGSLESADSTFQNPERLASAHYGVGDEEIHQYVKEEDTAYHAGNFDVNLTSIGIENEGSPTMPITDKTYSTLVELVKTLCIRYSIPVDREHIKGHKEVSNMATACPGNLNIDRVVKSVQESMKPPINYQDWYEQVMLKLLLFRNSRVDEALGHIQSIYNHIKEIEKQNIDLKKKAEELANTPPPPHIIEVEKVVEPKFTLSYFAQFLYDAAKYFEERQKNKTTDQASRED